MGDFRVPGFDVEELVGFGGSGEVWRARDLATGQLVALKRLAAWTGRPRGDRLRREAALLATMRHEHVIGLRAVVPTGDGLVLVLDYAEGGSLAAVLSVRGRLTPGEVVTIGAPLALALSDAHARGLIHGDVTPGNVLFDGSGKPLLADLGMARLVTESAVSVGATPGYADPARAGVRPGPADDVHGLAAVCFHALAGVPPYRPIDADIALRNGSLAALAPDGPAALVTAIEAGLDRDPAARPDASAFGRALFAACSAQAIRLVRTDKRVAIGAAKTHEVLDAGRRTPQAAHESTRGRHRRSSWIRAATSRVLRALVAAVGRYHAALRRGAVVACVAGLLIGAVAVGISWAAHDRIASASQAPTAVGSAPVSAAGLGSSSSPAPDWVSVLRGLDTSRDNAFIDANPAELAAVYLPGSAAFAADRTSLDQLMAAGQHAQGLQLQLVSVRAVDQSATAVTLAVRDTLADYEIVGPAGAVDRVPGRGDRSWTMVLTTTTAGQWLIASIAAA